MIFFSSLIYRYPESSDNLFRALKTEGLEYRLLENTRDVWIRDFMPIKTKSGKLISFRYEPGYLKDSPELKTNFLSDINSALRLPVTKSDIILDGGNVVFSPDRERAILSDRVFAENDIPRDELIHLLETLLEAEITVIPSLISDMTGHADGMVRFADCNTVVINEPYSKYSHETKVEKALQKKGLRTVALPFFWQAGAPISAVGSYINYLETERIIFLPIFGVPADESAISAAEEIFKKKITPVNINEIAADGGLLNCISWET